MSNPIKVVVADSQDLTRFGLRYLISGEKQLLLSGEAKSSTEAIDTCKEKNPQVLILDYEKTEGFTLDEIGRVKQASPNTNILVISSDEDRNTIHSILEKGVSSFLTKDCDESEVRNAIYATAKGEKFFCGKILDIIFEKHYTKEDEDACEPTELTTRELEIVQLVTEGKSTKEIANELCLSHHTIYTHKKNVMKKLGIKSTSELILYAVNSGLAAKG